MATVGKFKKGDKIRCIGADGAGIFSPTKALENGKEYIVTGFHSLVPYEVYLEGVNLSWHESRFELVTEETLKAPSDIAQAIASTCDSLKDLLLSKNKSYGNSALDPVRVFSKADPVEQLKVRIDDKLSRLMRGNGDFGEDTINDLIGYLVLLKVASQVNQDF